MGLIWRRSNRDCGFGGWDFSPGDKAHLIKGFIPFRGGSPRLERTLTAELKLDPPKRTENSKATDHSESSFYSNRLERAYFIFPRVQARHSPVRSPNVGRAQSTEPPALPQPTNTREEELPAGNSRWPA